MSPPPSSSVLYLIDKEMLMAGFELYGPWYEVFEQDSCGDNRVVEGPESGNVQGIRIFAKAAEAAIVPAIGSETGICWGSSSG